MRRPSKKCSCYHKLSDFPSKTGPKEVFPAGLQLSHGFRLKKNLNQRPMSVKLKLKKKKKSNSHQLKTNYLHSFGAKKKASVSKCSHWKHVAKA